MCRFACAIVIALLGANSIAQTATDLDCAQCVDGSEIENYSIPTWKLQNHTIGFNKLKSDVRDRMFGTEDRVEALEALVATLQAQVAALQAQAHPDPDPNNILSFFSLENTNDIVITSANLHVRNGVGQTDLANGLGNIIIGYNEDYQGGAPKERSGSHMLVIGKDHEYTQYGGVVVGYRNTATSPYASVSGGYNNVANGLHATVSGGASNIASGENAVVSGGNGNIASGVAATVSGGYGNTASGVWAPTVSGGSLNTASGQESTVSGGNGNEASGSYSSISGGQNNTTSGQYSSVSGGDGTTAVAADSHPDTHTP